MERVLLVRRRPLRRLRAQVRRLRHLRLQLVVPVGGWLLLSMTEVETGSGRIWLRMPTSAEDAGAARPKYALAGQALVIYRDESAYVAVEEEGLRRELSRYPDVRALGPEERVEFEQSLPFEMPLSERPRVRVVGLGDAIAWLARMLGVEECSGCRARRRRLNKLAFWGWWARPDQ